MLFMAGLAMAACSSDDRDTEPVRKTYTLTVNATKAANEVAGRAATRALSLDGNTLNASWATSEKVFVEGTYNGTTINFWFKGSIKPQTAGVSTVLSGTISLPDGTSYTSIQEAIGTISVPLNLQFPRSGDLDYGGQTGTLADIAARYDYATASIEVGIDQDRIVVPTQETVEFENQQAIVKFTLKTSDGTALLSPTALTIQYGKESLSLTIPADTYTTNGAGVIYVAIPGFSDKDVTLTTTVGDNTYTFTKSDITFENGEYYEINVKMNK